jgi:hypothetical protein
MVTFTVQSTSPLAISYQWRKNTVPISGETQSSYTINSAAVGDSGSYDVVVTNVVGSVTSSAAQLTVSSNLQITQQPQIVAIQLNGRATLSVAATSALPVSYQWLKSGAPISGANSAAFTIASVTSNDLGDYAVQVSDGTATLTSQTASIQLVDLKLAAGSYQALLVHDNSANPQERPYSGRVTIKITKKGSLSGKLEYQGKSYRFSGKLTPSLTYTKSVSRKNLPPVLLNLTLDGVAFVIDGTTDAGGYLSAAEAPKIPFNAKTNPAGSAGRYTALLSPNAPTSGPTAPSYALISVSKSGAVKILGKLADGTAHSSSALLYQDGEIAIYDPLYHSSALGHLAGPTEIPSPTSSSPVQGSLDWHKPAQTKGNFWPGGFAMALDVDGSRFIPAKGQRIIEMPGGSDLLNFSMQGPISSGTFNREVQLSILNKFTIAIPNTEKLKLTLDKTSGKTTGSYFDPTLLKTRKLEGVVLQGQKRFDGFFLGDTDSGSFSIQLPP